MATTKSEDTEITLGTGKMLALFFALVAICAVFFGAGFSLGRSASRPSAGELPAAAPATNAVARPSAVRSSSPDATKMADAQPPANPPAAASTNAATESGSDTPKDQSFVPPSGAAYYVQVAAVSKQEDADALVDALKKKQYPAFSAGNGTDKLIHVQVGPYTDVKDAEAMRGKLVSDGYNPILKK